MGNGNLIGKSNVPTLATASGLWRLPEQHLAATNSSWPDTIDANGLVVNYSGPVYSGTTWTNLGSGSTTYDGTMSNVTYSSSDLAMSFNGTSSYVRMTRPVQDDLSLVCQFKTTQSSTAATDWYNGRGLIDGEVSGVVADFGMSMADGKILFGSCNTGTTITTSNRYNDGAWHIAVATRTKSTGVIRLYIDGSFINSSNSGFTGSLTAPTYLTVGCIQQGITNFFSGSISRVLIYNRVLSDSDVTANYNAIKR